VEGEAMKDCEYSERVSELIDGALAPEEIDAVRRHLGSCAVCRETHRSFLVTREQLQALGASVTSKIDRRALDRITRPSQGRPSFIWNRTIRIPVPVAAALAIAMIALVVWLFASSSRIGSPPGRTELTRSEPGIREDTAGRSDFARFDHGGRAVIYKELQPRSQTAAQ
jgi:anti-sigma factor RsiW